MSDIHSNPYHLNPDKACERCVFGSGYHSTYCTAELDAWIAGKPSPTSRCQQFMRQCADGEYRYFDCCDTGMRSGGLAHDNDCEYGYQRAPGIDTWRG